MKYRLTKSGLKLSELSLGCMNLPPDETKAFKIMDYAVSEGINYFDTADLYQKGLNESLIGEYFKSRGKDDILIGSKVGNEFNQHNDDVLWNPSKSHIKEGFKATLSRLGLDYLDLYMLHGGTIEDNKEESIEAFNELKREGLIRAYGISSIRPNVIRYFLEHGDLDVCMMQFNPLDNRPEMLVDEIESAGVKILARGPVMKGLFTDDYKDIIETKFEDGLFSYTQSDLLHTFENINAPLTASSYKYLLSQPVVSIVNGASDVEQLRQNIKSYHQLKKASNIRSLFKNIVYEAHVQ